MAPTEITSGASTSSSSRASHGRHVRSMPGDGGGSEIAARLAATGMPVVSGAMNHAGENPLAFTRDYEYAQAIVADGPMVYVSGQGGFGPDGAVVDPDVEAQLRQAYANLAAVL